MHITEEDKLPLRVSPRGEPLQSALGKETANLTLNNLGLPWLGFCFLPEFPKCLNGSEEKVSMAATFYFLFRKASTSVALWRIEMISKKVL